MKNNVYVFLKELDYIQDQSIKLFLKKALEKAPSDFYTETASMTGKYHPIDDLGKGGIVHHVKKVVYIVKELSESYGIVHKDEMIAAALLHDIVKTRMPDRDYRNKKEWIMHGVNVKEFIYKHVVTSDVKDSVLGELKEKIDRIIRLCETHMGKWCEGHEPKTRAEWLLHTADMVASRKAWVVEEGKLYG